MTRKFGHLALFSLVLLLFTPAGRAVTLDQLDNFQDGTPMGWTNGGLAPTVTNISTGGPAGAGDRFIRVTADGNGAGGRLTTFNFTTWTGNFIGAGISTLEVDLRNQGSVNLSIRFAFEVDILQTAPGYLSAPMLLPVGGGWQHFSISITAPNLIAVNAPAAYNTFFSNIQEMRIINEVGTGDLNGDLVVGQLGIDNIHAVPEPGSVALVGVGLMAVALRFKRR